MNELIEIILGQAPLDEKLLFFYEMIKMVTRSIIGFGIIIYFLKMTFGLVMRFLIPNE